MPFDVALRKFSKIVEEAGVLQKVREKEYYEKPTAVRKRKRKEALKRQHRLNAENPIAAGRQFIPIYAGMVGFSIAAITLNKGLKNTDVPTLISSYLGGYDLLATLFGLAFLYMVLSAGASGKFSMIDYIIFYFKAGYSLLFNPNSLKF